MGLHPLGIALAALEEYEDAEAQFRQLQAAFREFGHESERLCFSLGEIAFGRKEYARAAQLYQEGLTAFSAIRDLYMITLCQLALGRVNAAQARGREARRHLRVALQTAMQLTWRPLLLDCLMGMAELFAEEGDLNHASHLTTLIIADSASRAMTKERAERLQAHIEKELSSDQIVVIRQRMRTSDLGTVAVQLLSELEAP